MVVQDERGEMRILCESGSRPAFNGLFALPLLE